MDAQDWQEHVKKLNQGISPDGLPINPPRDPDVPCDAQPGHYSYDERKYNSKTGQIDVIKRWYTIRKRT